MRAAIYHLLALFLVPVIGQAEAVAQTTGESQQAPSPRYSYVHHSSSGGSSFEDNSFGDNSSGGSPFRGLPSDHVSEVVRDSLGFAWIGTDQGLIRYDGHRMRLVEGAGSRPVTALHRRAGGGIWFANEAGIFAAVPSGDSSRVRRLRKSGTASFETGGDAFGGTKVSSSGTKASFSGMTKASLAGGILTVSDDLELEGLRPISLQPISPQPIGLQFGALQPSGPQAGVPKPDG